MLSVLQHNVCFFFDVTLLPVCYANRELFGKILTLIDFAELLILKNISLSLLLLLLLLIIVRNCSKHC